MPAGRSTPDRRLAELATGQHGVVSRDQVVAAGVSVRGIDTRLASGLLVPSGYRGVYLVGGAPQTWLQKVSAACLATDGVACSRTAGRLWDLPHTDTDEVHVLVAHERRIVRPGVTVHRTVDLPAADITRRRGIPVLVPDRLILQLGGQFTIEALEDVADDAVHRRLVTPADLQRRLECLASSGRPGIRALREVLDRRLPEQANPRILERKVHRLLQRHGLPIPIAEFPVTCSNGTTYDIDFAYPPQLIGFESDGYTWHGAWRSRWEETIVRHNHLERDGWHLYRFSATQVDRDPDGVADFWRSVLPPALLQAGGGTPGRRPGRRPAGGR